MIALTSGYALALERALRRGLPVELAAAACELHPAVVRAWLAQGDADAREGLTTAHADLYLAANAAAAEHAGSCLDGVTAAAVSGQWKAGVELLERVHGLARRAPIGVTQIETNAAPAAPVVVRFEGATPEQLRVIAYPPGEDLDDG